MLMFMFANCRKNAEICLKRQITSYPKLFFLSLLLLLYFPVIVSIAGTFVMGYYAIKYNEWRVQRFNAPWLKLDNYIL